MVKNGPILLIFGVSKSFDKFIFSTVRLCLDLGPKFWDFVKNGPILLIFGVMKSFHELFSHTKYEPNRSIFDKVQKFGPGSKFLKLVRFCSNSV